MITIYDYQLKTKISEITLKEFETISMYLNSNLQEIDKYLKVLESLGMPDEVLEQITIDDLIQIAKQFKLGDIDSYELTRSFELDGHQYEAYSETIAPEEFNIKARDFAKIENYIKQNPKAHLILIIAVLFKRTDLDRNDHYDENHIKHKAKLFEDLPAKMFVKYIAYINNILVKKLNLVSNEEQD